MKRFAFLLVLSCLGGAVLYPQTRANPYHQYSSFAFGPPGAYRTGLFGFENPALLQYAHQADLLFLWSETWKSSPHWSGLDLPASPYEQSWILPAVEEPVKQWGLFASFPGMGFGTIRQSVGQQCVTDYRVSLAAGDRSLAVGLGYGWSTGDRTFFRRSSVVTIGTLARTRLLSIGLFGTIPTEGDRWEAVLDLGARPFGTEVLTLFADFAAQHHQQVVQDGAWSLGAVAEPLPGIRLVGRYFDTKAVSLGLQISFGHGGVSAQTHLDPDGKRVFNTYGIRLGAYDRNIFRALLTRRTSYVPLELTGPISYQKFMFFDRTKKLADLLDVIDAAGEDPAVAGIAINTSGMRVDREMLWELREALKQFKTTGKRVITFVDLAGIDAYHFASVSDKIVMDPAGMMTLEGYVLGRTFYKGTLEKLGVGYDEWRFFKYKSAAEVLSRDSMSEADREQRQRLVDEFYRIARADIADSRGFSQDRFDALVDSSVLFLAPDAVAMGLVDTLGRWETVEDLITRLEGSEKSFRSPGTVERYELPYDAAWGEPPKIAVIYALGACAMDEGITARKLVKDVEAAVKDKSVKGIVLRVDSPGGDAMASDYIAEALKKAKGSKPVIVSQGSVAASGGYWLSMYADTIIAAPATITGSIGVIGGWMYDKGLKEKIGFSTDHVQAGAHADLGFGFALPFVGGLPDRNLTTEERARAELAIRTLYTEFVQKAADGREKAAEEIEAIAQGRVWSGADGKNLGLVDLLGGLRTAITVARERAGIPRDQPIAIVEYPKKGLFDFNTFMPKLIGTDVPPAGNEVLEMIKFRLKHNGRPMPLMSIDDLELTVK